MALEEKFYALSKNSVEKIVMFYAEATHQKHNNYRFIGYQMAGIIFFTITLNLLFETGLVPWILFGIMAFVGVVLASISYWSGRKYNYKYFLDEKNKQFHDLMYDAEIRNEIDNMISDVQ